MALFDDQETKQHLAWAKPGPAALHTANTKNVPQRALDKLFGGEDSFQKNAAPLREEAAVQPAGVDGAQNPASAALFDSAPSPVSAAPAESKPAPASGGSMFGASGAPVSAPSAKAARRAVFDEESEGSDDGGWSKPPARSKAAGPSPTVAVGVPPASAALGASPPLFETASKPVFGAPAESKPAPSAGESLPAASGAPVGASSARVGRRAVLDDASEGSDDGGWSKPPARPNTASPSAPSTSVSAGPAVEPVQPTKAKRTAGADLFDSDDDVAPPAASPLSSAAPSQSVGHPQTVDAQSVGGGTVLGQPRTVPKRMQNLWDDDDDVFGSEKTASHNQALASLLGEEPLTRERAVPKPQTTSTGRSGVAQQSSSSSSFPASDPLRSSPAGASSEIGRSSLPPTTSTTIDPLRAPLHSGPAGDFSAKDQAPPAREPLPKVAVPSAPLDPLGALLKK